jgi:general secretion pathway protein I
MTKQKGFTLLEALMAMMIFATSLLLLANSWSASFARVKKTQLNFELASLLDRKMNDVIREYTGKPLSDIPEDKEEDFDDIPKFSWKMTSKKFEFPDLSASLTARDGGADQTTLMIIKQLTEHINKAVKEVTVTILFKPEGGKPLEVSATTYFVDYDRPISMGPGGGG